MIIETLYIATMIALKVSLAIFYLRIAVRTLHRVTIYVALAVNSAFGIAFFFFAVFQCGSHYTAIIYLLRFSTGKCHPTNIVDALVFTHGALQTLTDLLFAILPVAILWDSMMKKSQKLAVYAILALGALYVVSLLKARPLN